MAKNTEIEIRTDLGPLDLFQGAEKEFYVTRQIHDLHNFETRNADFSKTIRVPPTPRNLQILDAYVGTESNSTIPCQVLMGGVTIASNAKLLFTKAFINDGEIGYNVVIFYGNFNLFNDIVVGTIDEINWADLGYDHTHDAYAAKSSNLTDLVTPIVDWLARDSPEVYFVDEDVEINTGGFFIYAREIIDRIIDEAGYEVTYENVPDEFFKIALACPVTKFFELADINQVSFSSVRGKSADTSANNAIVRVPFQVFVGGATGNWNNGASQWEINNNGNVRAEVRGTYSHIVQGNRPDSIIRLVHNAATIDSIAVNGNELDIDFFIFSDLAVLDGDVIFCEIESLAIQSTVQVNIDTLFSLSTQGLAADRNVQPSEFIPQLDKGEFITNILKLYNLVMETDDITKVVNVTSFNDIYSGAEADLTSILDVGKFEITKENSIDSLGQISRFEWQNDNLLRRDTDHNLKFENQLLAKEVTTISMMFSACDLSVYLYFPASDDGPLKAKIPNCFINRNGQSGNTIVTIASDGSYVMDTETNLQVGQWIQARESSIDNIYRVVQVDSLTAGFVQTPIRTEIIGIALNLTYIITGEARNPVARLAVMDSNIVAGAHYAVDGSSFGNTGNVTPFPSDARAAYWPDSLLWSNIVENEETYKPILDALQTPEVVKAWFSMPVAIFTEMDFLRPVYIEPFNAFYYINKIEQFKLEQKVRLELVRISVLTE